MSKQDDEGYGSLPTLEGTIAVSESSIQIANDTLPSNDSTPTQLRKWPNVENLTLQAAPKKTSFFSFFKKKKNPKIDIQSVPAPLIKEEMLPEHVAALDKFQSDYKLGDKVGAGGHSTVRLAWKKDKQQVVCKIVNSSTVWFWCQDNKKTVPVEVFLLRKLSHLPNVIKCIDFIDIGPKFVIVLEYLGKDWMDLYDYIEFYAPLQEDYAMDIFTQVCRVIHTMHSLGISHNDIKDENVMINSRTRTIKLIDFGSATSLSDQPIKTFYGTRKFACPLVVQEKAYHQKDQEIWALGTLLYVMLFKMDPFKDDDQITSLDIRKRMHRYKSASDKYQFSQDTEEWIGRMLEKDPVQRPSLDSILQWLENKLN